MFRKLLLVSIVFSVSFPSLSIESFNENYDSFFDRDSLFADDLGWAEPSNSTLLSFSSEIKYSGNGEEEQFLPNFEYGEGPVFKKFKGERLEDGEKETENCKALNPTFCVNVVNNYYNINNYYYTNSYDNLYSWPKVDIAATNEPNSSEKINTQNESKAERKGMVSAGLATSIRETQKVAKEMKKNHAGHNREKEYNYKGGLRCPVLRAMLSCVKDKKGASFIEKGQRIEVNNLTDLFQCMEQRCNKPRPTSDWFNRLKSLQKHFSGFPNKDIDTIFKVTPINPDHYNKIREEVYAER